MIDPQDLIARLEAIRQHYNDAILLHEKQLPQSATLEEIAGTRKINRLILDLESHIKRK
jgi:hypothetical protein